jgi:hypothetical protein
VKPTLAETYVEPTEAEWRTRFLFPAMLHKDRLENQKLTIEELIEESEVQLLEAFAYFLCLSPEQQERCARQFKEGLERVKALRENNHKRAEQMLMRGHNG